MSVKAQLYELRDEIISLASKHGVRKISIFGSTVRGEETTKSDIDFLVDFEENRTLFDLIRLKQDLEDLLGRSVDVVTLNAIHKKIKNQIIDEAVQL